MKKTFVILTICFTFISTNAQWQQMSGPVGGFVNDLSASGQNIYAGTRYGVYKSTNYGQNWFQTRLNGYSVESIFANDSDIYAGTDTGGVFISNDYGQSWLQTPLGIRHIEAVALLGPHIIAGSYQNGTYISTNNGLSWSQSTLNYNVQCLAVENDKIYAGTRCGGIYLSEDSGRTWINIGLNNNCMNSIALSDPYIFASSVYTFFSTNKGQTWIPIPELLHETQRAILINGSNVYVGSSGIKMSTNYGLNWFELVYDTTSVSSFALMGMNLFAGVSGEGVYLSADSGFHWVRTPLNGLSVLSIYKNNSYILAGTLESGTYISTNFGKSWLEATNSTIGGLHSFIEKGANLFSAGIGVWVSTDNGFNWTQTSQTTLHYPVSSLVLKDSIFFAGSATNGSQGGVYTSTDEGLTWNQTSFDNQCVNALVTKGADIFAATGNLQYGVYGAGVYHSSNNGLTWTNAPVLNQVINALAVCGTKIFAGTHTYMPGDQEGVFVSTDNGASWSPTSLNKRIVNTLAVSGSNIFAGTAANGVYVSTDEGSTWRQINEGMGNQSVNAIIVSDDSVYSGNRGSSIWKRSLSEIIGVQNNSGLIPETYYLQQNYPNPFNPLTFIEFGVKEDGFVSLKIYDLQGREIAILVNQQLKPGIYTINWQANGYPSGVYFYQLITNKFLQTRKMVLLR